MRSPEGLTETAFASLKKHFLSPPALPTTGMPGIEHRNQERRALHLSAPQ
jgi:hypothetical protein